MLGSTPHVAQEANVFYKAAHEQQNPHPKSIRLHHKSQSVPSTDNKPTTGEKKKVEIFLAGRTHLPAIVGEETGLPSPASQTALQDNPLGVVAGGVGVSEEGRPGGAAMADA